MPASLREELARWFRVEITDDTHEPSGKRQGLAEKCADECIRQMEWARQRCATTYEGGGDFFAYTKVVRPLTLAPPEWKP